MRPFRFDWAPPPLRDPEPDVFFALALFAEDVPPPEPDDFDFDVPPLAALLLELAVPDAPPFDELVFEAPPFEAPPFAADVRDPDFEPAELAAERVDPADLDEPARDDEPDFDAVVFFVPDLVDEELFVDFEEDAPDFDFDPDVELAVPDFEFDDFDAPDLEPPDLDEVDFEVEDFLVVGIFCFLRLHESENMIRRLLSKQHSTPTSVVSRSLRLRFSF